MRRPCGGRGSTTANWPTCGNIVACKPASTSLGQPRWFAFTTRGTLPSRRGAYADGDALVFGPETRGLPDDVLERCPAERRLRIPMLAGARSLNLSNAVAVAVYEAWRQPAWDGATPSRP